jgi:hypothetical protein
VFIVSIPARSRAAFVLAFLIAAACSGDRKPAAPPAAPPAATPAAAPAAEPGTAAPAPSLGLVPLPPLPEDTALALLNEYRLSLAKLQQWSTAQMELNQVTKKYPDMLPKMQARPKPKTLDEMIAMIGNEPRIRSALAKSGTNARDYVLTMTAMRNAMEGYGRMSQGNPLPPNLPPAVAENIVFVQKNLPAIQQILGSMAK